LTALELNKLKVIKRAAYVVADAYVREINPQKKAMAKKQLRKSIG
jgi:hypothetical protein